MTRVGAKGAEAVVLRAAADADEEREDMDVVEESVDEGNTEEETGS